MAVFNFTVRATDSEGSYADRQFNITVRNSRVERFMAVTSTDAWTSPDGTTWTQRNGQSGFTCAYGNGFWLILKSQATGTSALKSTDGINYSAILPANQTFVDETGTAITGLTNGPIFTALSLARLRFWNGRFWIVTTNGSNQSGTSATMFYDLWSTADGITWRRNRLLTLSSGALNTPPVPYLVTMYEDNGTFFIPFSCSYNTPVPAAGNNWCYGWSTTDGTTFTQIRDTTVTSSTSSTFYGASILNRINGVYFVMPTTTGGSTNWTQTTFRYSTDGLNWTTSTFNANAGTNAPLNFVYANGQVYSFTQKQSSGVGSTANYFTSSDGVTWNMTEFKSFNTTAGVIHHSVYKNGVFLMAGSVATGTDTNNSTLSVPNNGLRVSVDGSTWTSVNVGSGTINYADVAAM
jgi:hypothetical protein